MIETRLLHYFLAVAREQNITKAAQTLFISQSTLSKQMMDLEKQLGTQLFIRGKRKVTLTEDGVFFRSRAREIMKLLENTETALHTDTKNLNGDIFIGCGETVAMDSIAGLMAEFHQQYPDVKFHTYSGDADAVIERIDKGLCDMGLLLGPVRQEKYDYLNLHQKDIYGLLMPADCRLAAQDTINIDQLKSLPMILADQTFYGQVRRRCPECSRYLQSDLQCHFSGRARHRLRPLLRPSRKYKRPQAYLSSHQSRIIRRTVHCHKKIPGILTCCQRILRKAERILQTGPGKLPFRSFGYLNSSFSCTAKNAAASFRYRRL